MVAIKDMEMPNSCAECGLFHFYLDTNSVMHHICKYRNVEMCGDLTNKRNDICPLSAVNDMPLPKGHGRLLILSEDAVKREQTPLTLNFSCQKWISEVGLSNATVAIIEAESEVEHAEALRSPEESSSADA